jgi:vesicle coat complex subunit
MTSAYFQHARSSELSELQEELNSLKPEKKKEAVKQVIATMTVGKDVSVLFPHVVKCMVTSSIELKKLVYLYIINYCKSKPDLTIMAINTFRNDAHESSSPLLRALAVRTMGCIRIEKISEYLCESLKDTLTDSDAYVRKTAAICVSKLFVTSPRIVKDHGFIKMLQTMLSDGNSIVVANAIASLAEISSFTGRNYIKFNSNVNQKLLFALNECSEWGQIYILEALSKYSPEDSTDAENIIERVVPRLAHVNAAVVMSAVKVVVKLMDFISNVETIRKLTKKLSAPLITLLSTQSELQYVALRNIHFIIQKRTNIFDKSGIKNFFVKYADPLYVMLEKLDILVKVTENKNIDIVLNELKEYSAGIEYDLVRKSIKCIGLIACKLEKASKKALDILQNLLKFGQEGCVDEVILAMANILRKYPGKFESSLKDICQKGKETTEEEARAAYAWVLGEYAEPIEDADTLLSSLLETFADEGSLAQQQILTAIVKLYLKRPDDGDQMITEILKLATEESENPDIRDRAYIYWRMLSTDPEKTKHVVLSERPPTETTLPNTYEDEFVDFLIENMSSVVSVYHKPLENFIAHNHMVKKIPISDDEYDQEEKRGLERRKKKQKKKKDHEKEKEKDKEEEEEEKGKKKTKGKKKGKKKEDLDSDENHEEEIKEKKGIEEHKIEPLKDLLDLNIGESAPRPSGNVNLFSNVYENEEEDKMFLTDNGKSEMVEPVNANIAGVAGKKGLNIKCAFVKTGSQILLRIILKNLTPTPLTNFAVQFNKNSFGLEPTPLVLAQLSANGKEKLMLNCIISTENLNSEEPPSCPFKIQTALACSLDTFYFEIPCLLHILLSSTSPLAKDKFKEFWQGFQHDRGSELVNLKAHVKNVEGMKLALEDIGVRYIAHTTKKDTQQTMLYFSSSTVNNIPLLVEIALPSLTNPNGAKILAKVPVAPLAPLLLQSLIFILQQ